MTDFVEKIMGCISEFLWLRLNWVFQVVSGKFQLTCSTSCGSSFYFWKNYFVIIPLGFLFKQNSTIIFIIGFQSNIKSFKSLFPERKPSQVCAKLSFQSWHTRNTLYLTLAYLSSTLVRCPSYSLSFKKWVECMSKSRGLLDLSKSGDFWHGVTGICENGHVCYKL